METSKIVREINRLTSQWISGIGNVEEQFVSSGLGVWVLLATLLVGADGQAKIELEAATGLKQSEAIAAVADIMELLEAQQGFKSAIAIWVQDSIELLPEFVSQLPEIAIAPMPQSQSVLNQWVAQLTENLIEEFPLEIDQETLLVLASALAANGEWEFPFTDVGGGVLHVDYVDLNKAALLRDATTTVSRIIVSAKNGLDVHLLAGSESDSPDEVLTVGLSELDGSAVVTPGDQLKDGDSAGCLEARLRRNPSKALWLTVPQFQVSSTHNLLDHASVFGLQSASENSQVHFPSITSSPLAVGEGAQSATISFGAEGFKAAAVTAVALFAGSVSELPPDEKSLVLQADFYRSFGFIVVQRSTKLALFTGWVAKECDDSSNLLCQPNL